MQFRFAKMHGLGNDFIVVDTFSQRYTLSSEQIQQLGDRYEGIGFDQLLLVEAPQSPDADFSYRIFNSDGQEVEHCGNGARCFALYVHRQRLTGKSKIVVETAKGKMVLYMYDAQNIKVDMGEPILQPAEIPFLADAQSASYTLDNHGHTYEVGAVSMGNPHCVLIVDDAEQAPVETLGSQLREHHQFPQQANIGFMQIIDRGMIKLRVFERGVGETQACGTGACAAVVSGILRGDLDSNVLVHLRRGDLQISWQGIGHSLYMTGSANYVFDGKLRL